MLLCQLVCIVFVAHCSCCMCDLEEPELVEVAIVEAILCRRNQTICKTRKYDAEKKKERKKTKDSVKIRSKGRFNVSSNNI